MIFVGDISSPTKATTSFLENSLARYDQIFKGNRIVCNFEGLIFNGEITGQKIPVLYNDPSVPNTLYRDLKPVLCLANNHILDLPDQFHITRSLLNSQEIPFCGAGFSPEDAGDPIIFTERSVKVAIFNACWDFLLYNTNNPAGGIYVSVIDEKKVIHKIALHKNSYPDIHIVVFLHWNFDLETLPFPMHRKFARVLIDAGANIVVGSHSHCVQGGEKYRGGYIVYGLGNFFMPHEIFINGKLTYPEFASHELALEWDPVSNKAICHWFRYRLINGSHNLIHITSEEFHESALLENYSPFKDMTDEEYFIYFKKNRRKKILIPIYRDFHNQRLNNYYTFFLKSRAGFARIMARAGIIKWQN